MTFQGFLKDSPTVFKDYKFLKNNDLHVKNLLWKFSTKILEIGEHSKLTLFENYYKIVAPLFGAAYAAPN